jgi:DNA-binding IclR family transcriptional regulator
MTKKNAKYYVPALEKGLDILEALAAAPQPQSLSDLARTLNRSSGELFRMINCLEQRRYIVKEEYSGNYRLSLKLYELAHTHSPVEYLLRSAARPMQELAQTVRESCHLSMLRHHSLIVLAQAESPEKVRLSVEIGSHFSPLHTASGRLLLAYLPQEELAAFLEEDADYSQMTETEQKNLMDSLAQTRDRGYSLAQDESHIGIKDLAVLVGNPRVGLTATLAIASLAATGRQEGNERLLRALQACAQTITQAIGIRSHD